MEPISYLQAIILGALQGISEPFPISSLGHAVLLPKLLGWNIHQNDNYFLSFLVATPIIFAATADQMLHLHKGGAPSSTWAPAVLAAVVAGVTAFASTAFLMRYFRSHEDWAMSPFAIYCVLFGAASFVFLYI